MIARETIEQQVNSIYQTQKETALAVNTPSVAEIDFRVTELDGALVFNNNIQTHEHDLCFDLERTEPMLMMYFQLRGAANFIDNNPFSVPPVHHSLNFVPMFRSRCMATKNSRIQNLCIKMKPSTILKDLPAEMFGEDWLKSVESGEPLITLHKSRPMNLAIQQNINQLINCPYSGDLGKHYRLSLIQVLLVQQIGEFAVDKAPENNIAIPKLTKADISALHDLKKHLVHHFLEDVPLDTLARRSGLNSFKLKYGFRKLFNTSVMRFIDEQKMNYAKELLMSDDAGDRFDLSDMLGYNHYSNFSTAFKKHFGHSPCTFKQQYSYTGQNMISK